MEYMNRPHVIKRHVIIRTRLIPVQRCGNIKFGRINYSQIAIETKQAPSPFANVVHVVVLEGYELSGALLPL